MIPSREIPFFGEAPKRFWAIIAKFGCIRVSSGDPKNRITEYSVIRFQPNNRIFGYSVIRVTRITEFGDLVFFGFIRMINRKNQRFRNRCEIACAKSHERAKARVFK
jgi:hypothetical protein